jgi:hypothetical protein
LAAESKTTRQKELEKFMLQIFTEADGEDCKLAVSE